MSKARLAPGKKHRLEVYFRIGQRMRVGPLLMGLLGGVLLGVTYLPPGVLSVPWLGAGRRPLVVALIFLSALLYVVNVVISRVSVVQARPEHLYVRAGLMPLVVSYARIRSLRPVRVGQQFPPKSLKEGERALLEPLFGETAVAVDLKSFPMSEATLRRMWSKFMFLTDQKGLMLVVRDAMGLIQEIDAHRQKYLERKAGISGRPQDVFDRVAAQQRRR